MLISLNVVSAHPLSGTAFPVSVGDRVRDSNNKAFDRIFGGFAVVLIESHDVSFGFGFGGPIKAAEFGDGFQSKFLCIEDDLIPWEALVVFIPYAENEEVVGKVVVVDGVFGVEVLSGDSPLLRDHVFDPAVKGFYPAAGVVMFRQDGTGMDVVGVHVAVFAVHF